MYTRLKSPEAKLMRLLIGLTKRIRFMSFYSKYSRSNIVLKCLKQTICFQPINQQETIAYSNSYRNLLFRFENIPPGGLREISLHGVTCCEPLKAKDAEVGGTETAY